MPNNQPIEKPDRDPDGCLDVVRIWRTIQGEGPLTGMPAVFVRLAGCNLQCSWCDTDYRSGRHMMGPEQLTSAVLGASRDSDVIVLTGGEPFRQNIRPLLDRLTAERLVQIETNGTLFLPVPSRNLVIVCSPKTPKINDQLAQEASSWKYIVKAGELADDGLPVGLARPLPSTSVSSVFVQPLDEGDPGYNRANQEAAVGSCLIHGYRLSLQVHKIVGVD